tara:strand:+ start:10552 stop:10941 length:390 start_codon:yes stop_codon:yes gene_type:complete
MGSSSSTASDTKTTNIDDRVAVAEGGVVLQTEGSNSTIMFEDVSADILEQGFNLAGGAIELILDKASGLYDTALTSNTQALANTQSFSESLVKENNTPGSDNMTKIAVAGLLVAGVSTIAILTINKDDK